MLSKLKEMVFGPDYKEIADKTKSDAGIIDLNHIKHMAEKHYRDGDFYCSESIIRTFIDEFQLDLPDDAVAMASVFPVGMGHSGCSCGAVIGAQMMIGYFFGRRKAGGKKVEKAMELSAEMHDLFMERHGSLCCRVLTKDHTIGSKEHIEQCISFTGEMAYEAASIICRELDLEHNC